MDIIRFRYQGYLTPEDNLVITGKHTSFFTGDFFIYLAVGCLVIVFSLMFKYGTTLKEENDMTV